MGLLQTLILQKEQTNLIPHRIASTQKQKEAERA